MEWAASWVLMPSSRRPVGICTRHMMVDSAMPTQPWRICGRDTVAVPREVLSGRFLSRSESG